MVMSAADLVGSGVISINLVKGSTATTISIEPTGAGGFGSIIKSRHQSLNSAAPFLLGRR